jgi:hypothetical protein
MIFQSLLDIPELVFKVAACMAVGYVHFACGTINMLLKTHTHIYIYIYSKNQQASLNLLEVHVSNDKLFNTILNSKSYDVIFLEVMVNEY